MFLKTPFSPALKVLEVEESVIKLFYIVLCTKNKLKLFLYQIKSAMQNTKLHSKLYKFLNKTYNLIKRILFSTPVHNIHLYLYLYILNKYTIASEITGTSFFDMCAEGVEKNHNLNF